MTLNDNDVQKQIQRLISFINQEAITKVEEIDAKAEEEFQIEKARIIQSQRIKIGEFYQKKIRQLELAKKIKDSTLMNAARLKVLVNRDNYIHQLLDESRSRLLAISRNPNQYPTALSGLITQGLLQLVEPNVNLKCRADDVDLVQSLLPQCIEEFKRQTGMNCNVTLNSTSYLPKDCCGGVELSVRQGRICVDNTLDARLDQVAEKMMPQIREQLFGVNKNRKFRT
nr:cysteine and histidine rich domain containing protein [Hymenolepis microstoma]